jgi:hypothetical protein
MIWDILAEIIEDFLDWPDRRFRRRHAGCDASFGFSASAGRSGGSGYVCRTHGVAR